MKSFLYMLSMLMIVVPISGQISTTSAPITCPPGSELGAFAIPGQCVREYYVCVVGNALLQICPGLWLYDPETLKCAPPDQVSCLQPTTSEPPPFTCPATGTGPFPASNECVRRYYFCLNGTLFHQTCPGGNVFDPLALRCTAPEACLATEPPSSSTVEPTAEPTTNGSTEGATTQVTTTTSLSTETSSSSTTSTTSTEQSTTAGGQWLQNGPWRLTLAISLSLTMLHGLTFWL